MEFINEINVFFDSLSFGQELAFNLLLPLIILSVGVGMGTHEKLKDKPSPRFHKRNKHAKR